MITSRTFSSDSATLAGVWQVVDDQPVAVRDFLNDFAGRLGARPPKSVPAWLAKLLAGKQAVEFFTRATWTSNKKFCDDFQWRPSYCTYREGLAEVVGRWNAKGQ